VTDIAQIWAESVIETAENGTKMADCANISLQIKMLVVNN
jgi:hypothetical protein